MEFLTRSLHGLDPTEKEQLLRLTISYDGSSRRSFFEDILRDPLHYQANSLLVIVSEKRIGANIWPRYYAWGMIWWFTSEIYSSHVGLYVDPYHRQQGLGRIILQRLRRLADVLGFNPIAKPSTAHALKLYQSTGFVVDKIHMPETPT